MRCGRGAAGGSAEKAEGWERGRDGGTEGRRDGGTEAERDEGRRDEGTEGRRDRGTEGDEWERPGRRSQGTELKLAGLAGSLGRVVGALGSRGAKLETRRLRPGRGSLKI